MHSLTMQTSSGRLHTHMMDSTHKRSILHLFTQKSMATFRLTHSCSPPLDIPFSATRVITHGKDCSGTHNKKSHRTHHVWKDEQAGINLQILSPQTLCLLLHVVLKHCGAMKPLTLAHLCFSLSLFRCQLCCIKSPLGK